MKKALIALFLIVLLTLTACGDSFNPQRELALPLRITAHLEGSDALFTASVYEDGCDVVFDESHSLAGTELHFRNTGNTAHAGDFTRDVKNGTFPAQESLFKALTLLNRDELLGQPIENGTKYTIDEMTIMVYYNKDTKQLTGIGTEENGRRFDFVIVGRDRNEIQSNGAG